LRNLVGRTDHGATGTKLRGGREGTPEGHGAHGHCAQDRWPALRSPRARCLWGGVGLDGSGEGGQGSEFRVSWLADWLARTLLIAVFLEKCGLLWKGLEKIEDEVCRCFGGIDVRISDLLTGVPNGMS